MEEVDYEEDSEAQGSIASESMQTESSFAASDDEKASTEPVDLCLLVPFALQRLQLLFAAMRSVTGDLSRHLGCLDGILGILGWSGDIPTLDQVGGNGISPSWLRSLATFLAREDQDPPSLLDLQNATTASNGPWAFVTKAKSLTAAYRILHPGLGGLRSAIKVPVATEAEAMPPGPAVPPVAVPPYPLSIPCEEEDNEATRQKLVAQAANRQDDLRNDAAPLKELAPGKSMTQFVEDLPSVLLSNFAIGRHQRRAQMMVANYVSKPPRLGEDPLVAQYRSSMRSMLKPPAEGVWDPWVYEDILATRIADGTRVSTAPTPLSVGVPVDPAVSNPARKQARHQRTRGERIAIPERIDKMIDCLRVAEDFIVNVAADILEDEQKPSESPLADRKRRIAYLSLAAKTIADTRTLANQHRRHQRLQQVGFSRAVLDAQLGSLAAPPTEKGLLSPDQMLALTKAQLAEDTEVEKRKLEAKKASQASSITRLGNFFPTGPSQPRGRGRGAFRGGSGRGGKFSAPHPRSPSPKRGHGQHGKRGRGTF